MNGDIKQNLFTIIPGKRVRRVQYAGFFVRLGILLLILGLKDYVDPYMIADDIKYEETAIAYLKNADSVFDFSYLNKLLKGYMQPFWPIVMCLSAGIFRSVYAGRFINIILSTLCIDLVYRTVLVLSKNEKTALFAGKLFAFLPITVLTPCFPIKDIYLTWAILYAFYTFILVNQREKIRPRQIIICVLALIGVYFARGAVTELMVIFFAFLLFDALRKKKKLLHIVGLVLIVGLVWYLYGDAVIASFETKIEDYSGYNKMSDGLSILQMQSPKEFYKLPFAYFFATIQPMTLNYFASISNLWMWLIRFTNISIYPIAIANILYLFQRKHNFLYWLFSALIYCAIISMSLGIFRHYLFLIPIEIINCALLTDRKIKNTKSIILLGTFGMICIVALYSVIVYS